MSWRDWFSLPLTRKQREREIAREIRAHLELAADDRRDAGMSPDAARAKAARAFGNRTVVGEDMRAIWGTPSLDALLQDLRYAVRTIRRAPGFAAIAVGSTALGIGACSAIFAIANFAVYKPMPVAEPERLMSLSEIDRRTGEANDLSYLDFRDLREARAFEGVAACKNLLSASIGTGEVPQRHWGSMVTADYFSVVRPGFALGGGFDAGRDDTRGAPRVIVLSHDLWRTRFAGDPAIVGREVAVNNRAATVIGVTARGFRGTNLGIRSEFWIPFSMIDEVEARSGRVTENRRRFWLSAVARLRPDADASAARAEIDVIARRLNATYGRPDDRGFDIERAGQLDSRLRGIVVPVFSVALAVTALVLLTACSNVANLLLGRASARRREIAARMALGASRGRLIRQLLTESLLLAMLGGAGGLAIAAYLSSLLAFIRIPLGWPLDLSVSLDYRVLLFCSGLTLATGIAFGLVPALRATKADVITDLKADARISRIPTARFGLRSGLVVTQVAICTVLVVCMGLFLRNLQVTRAIDLGLTKHDLLLLAFDPGMDHRPDPESKRLLRSILDTARVVPGVESATLTTTVPLTMIISNSNFVSEEVAADKQAPRVRTDIYRVAPEFFTTMGIPFLTGADFRVDQTAKGIAIVNEAFATAAFAGTSPIGRRVLGDGKQLNIVGVVATAKSRTFGEAPRPAIYLPILDEYSAVDNPRGVTLVVKSRPPLAASADQLREVIRGADRSLAVFDVRTMGSHVNDALIVPRLVSAVSAAAGSIGLVIATVGVYGVISFAVARRRRELGIRLAIGAAPREILTMILRQGATLALAGIALGLLISLSVTRFAATLLYGVDPADPLTFIVVPAFLFAVAVLACLLPARSAARLDPVEVLRRE